MKQTMLLKLAPTEDQRQSLLETMHAFNAAATYVAEIAFGEKTANKLPAQLAIRTISKASEAYKRNILRLTRI